MRALLSLLFPPSCLACARVEAGLRTFCETCVQTVEPLPEDGCSRCGEPGEHRGGVCRRCAAQPPAYSRALAGFIHGGAIARAIHAFKYEDRPDLAGGLAELLIDQCGPFLAQAPPHVSALPLHRTRFQTRKYDQAQLLAKQIARRTGRVFWPQALRRTRATEQQVGLAEPAREANVAGAFAAAPQVRGRGVLLIDDVLTTGATARAAAGALREAGASDVRVLTLARAYSG